MTRSAGAAQVLNGPLNDLTKTRTPRSAEPRPARPRAHSLAQAKRKPHVRCPLSATPTRPSSTDNVVPRTRLSRRHSPLCECPLCFTSNASKNPCATRPPSRARPRCKLPACPLYFSRAGPPHRSRATPLRGARHVVPQVHLALFHRGARRAEVEHKNPASRLASARRRRHATWTSRSGSAARRRRRRGRRPSRGTRAGGTRA